ncbi:MAG: MFS transporter [Patescibacteria group bacterium]
MTSTTHHNVRLLTWFNFCLDFRIYGAITALYFAQVTGSYTLGLSVFAIGTIASSLFEVPTGVFSDFIGRKRTLILGQFAGVLGVLCYAIGGSFFVLALGAVLEGLASALFSGNNSALLYESLKEDNLESEYATYEGKASSMFQFALAFSALIGALVLGWWTFAVLFWLSVIPQVIGLGIAFNFVDPKVKYNKVSTNIFEHFGKALQKFWQDAKLRTLSLAKIIDQGLGEALHQLFPILSAMLWPVWALSLATFLASMFAAVGFRVAGGFVKKFGEPKVLLGSGAVNFVIKTAIIAYPTVATPFINTLTSFTFATGVVAQNSLQQKGFTDEQRATMSSLTSLAGSAMFAISALGLGMLADTVGPVQALLVGQIITICVLILYWRVSKMH